MSRLASSYPSSFLPWPTWWRSDQTRMHSRASADQVASTALWTCTHLESTTRRKLTVISLSPISWPAKDDGAIGQSPTLKRGFVSRPVYRQPHPDSACLLYSLYRLQCRNSQQIGRASCRGRG